MDEFKHMFSLLLRIVQQLFAKVLKSGHRLTFAGRTLNKVVCETCKVPLTREMPSRTNKSSMSKLMKV